tara:strand:- start:129 stop:599 length:471 start_codon:yes stop_codon:yes gene_type:complete
MENITISANNPALINFNQEMADNILAVQILLDADEKYTDEINKLFERRSAIQTNLIEAATNTNRNDWRFTVWAEDDNSSEYSFSFNHQTCSDYLDGVSYAFQPDWDEVVAEGITAEQIRNDNAQWNKGMLYAGCAIWVDDVSHADEGYYLDVSAGL